MPNNNTNVPVVDPSNVSVATDNGTGQNPVSSTVTSDGSNQNVNNVNANATQQPNTQPAQPSQTENGEVKSDNDYNALKGKVSSLEKERNNAISEQRAYLESLDDVFVDDPDKYEKYRNNLIQKTGRDPGTWDKLYGTTNNPTAPNNQAAIQPQTVDPVVIATQVDKIQEDKKILQGFFTETPDLDFFSTTATDEERQQRFKTVNIIANTADNIRALNPNLSAQEALIEARNNLLPNYRQQVVEQAQKQGEILGKQSALSTGAGSTIVPSGQAPTTPSGLVRQLTSDEQSRADRLQGNVRQIYLKNIGALK